MPDAGFLATILLLMDSSCWTGIFHPKFWHDWHNVDRVAGRFVLVCLESLGRRREPAFFWTYVFVFVTGVPGTFFGAIQLIQHTPAGKHVVLQPVEAKPIEEPLKHLIGCRGTALTLLTPGG